MEQKGLFIVTICIFLLFVISSYTGFPPLGTTNAPGETTCATNGSCHGGIPDTGYGFSEITIMGGVPAGNLYIPGQTYTLMPYLIDTSKLLYGFQTVAKLVGDISAGSVTITDPVKTQFGTLNGKEYVTQTAAGTVVAGMHDWMYDWQAPPMGSGTVTIYGAFIAADGDATSSGDNIYTDTLVLYEDTSSSLFHRLGYSKNLLIKQVFPIPVVEHINIDFKSDLTGLSISVTDINGKSVIKENSLTSPVSFYRLNLDILPKGIYFIKVKQHNKLEVKKVIKL